MKAVNEKLAEHYRNMLYQICDIIAESDGVIHIAELKQIETVKTALAD